MAENKRYYWLRLHDDFFSSLRIKKLRKMAGGDTYTIIYLKMQLKALKTDGILTFSGLEQDFAEELALDLDEEVEDVKVTLAYLLHCGLAESDDQTHYFLPYAVANTGNETSSTQRSRECRARKMLQCNTNATQLQQSCNGEIEIEKETRDRDRGRVEPAAYSLPHNITLSDKELIELQRLYPDWQGKIAYLSSYLEDHPQKQYKSHFATICKWATLDSKPSASSGKSKKGSFDMDKHEYSEEDYRAMASGGFQ